MSWSQEDRLIIDSVLNRVAQAIRQIEQEEWQQAPLQNDVPLLSLVNTPANPQGEAA